MSVVIGDQSLPCGLDYSLSDRFILNAGVGADTIINFGKNDLLGLTNGLTFNQLSITQGINGNEFFTQVSIA